MEMHKTPELSMLEFATKKQNYIYDCCTSNVIYSNEVISYIIANFYKMKKDKIKDYVIENFIISEDSFETKYLYISNLISRGMFYINSSNVNTNNSVMTKELSYYSNSSQLILVLTEQCNLRCEYCIYTDKYPDEIGYSNQEMTFEIAKKSIDLYADLHRERAERGIKKFPVISFYGGEPLLKFDLVKSITKYAKKVLPNVNIYITTNGTLINEEIIDYFIENNVIVTFSLDGYKENHDRNRTFITGKPTFDIVIDNIRKLQLRKKELGKQNLIMFNCCYDRYTDLYKTAKFFEENFELFDPYYVMYAPISPFDTTYYDWCDSKYKNDKEFKKENLTNSMKKVKDILYNKDSIINENFNQVSNQLILGDYSLAIRNRGSLSVLRNSCTPTSKLAVSPDGTIALCEKMCKRLPVGNVNTGLEWDKVDAITKKLIEFFDIKCSKCFARTVCEACFMHMNEDGSIRESFCDIRKGRFTANLIELYSALEDGIDVTEMFRHQPKFDQAKEMML